MGPETHTFCDLYTCLKETFNLTSIHDTCYRRCLMWRPSMAMHPSTLRQSFYTTVSIQYLFPRCLPCLSRRRTHNQTLSTTMDKCTDLGKYAFPDPCLLELFSLFWCVLPPLKIFDTFLIPCGPGGSSGKALSCGLDGPGSIPGVWGVAIFLHSSCPDWPWGPLNLL